MKEPTDEARNEPRNEPGKNDHGKADELEAGRNVDPDRIQGDAERTVERTLEREEERGVPRADHEPDVAERLQEQPPAP